MNTRALIGAFTGLVAIAIFASGRMHFQEIDIHHVIKPAPVFVKTHGLPPPPLNEIPKELKNVKVGRTQLIQSSRLQEKAIEHLVPARQKVLPTELIVRPNLAPPKPLPKIQ